jgi:hypothetical protein
MIPQSRKTSGLPRAFRAETRYLGCQLCRQPRYDLEFAPLEMFAS